MNHIYILKLNNNKYYTGITNNIDRRLKEHLNGKSKSTKYHRPISLVSLLDAQNMKLARKLEVRIKNKGARLFMIGNKFEARYDDLVQYPDMLRFIVTIKFKVLDLNNERLITFPEYAL